MKSTLNQQNRQHMRDRMMALTPGERLALALQMGRRDLEMFAAAHNLSLRAAKEHLQAKAATGRKPSRCSR